MQVNILLPVNIVVGSRHLLVLVFPVFLEDLVALLSIHWEGVLVVVSCKHIWSDLVDLIISFAFYYFSEALLVHGYELFLEIDHPFEIKELRHLLSRLFVGRGNLIDGSLHELGEYLLLEWIERVDLDHQIKEEQFLLHVIHDLF